MPFDPNPRQFDPFHSQDTSTYTIGTSGFKVSAGFVLQRCTVAAWELNHRLFIPPRGCTKICGFEVKGDGV
jgi:hypothetical protein